jgi:phytoene dehydrogenase-like protein
LNVIYRYLLIALACAALLVGAQAPAFVEQYRHRLDAHLAELTTDLEKWQAVADKYFNGSLQALLDYHARSVDKVFQAEADPLREMLDRRARFSVEAAGLQGGLPHQLLYLASRGDPELLDETWRGYGASVPLNASGLLAGVTLALVVLVLAECMSAVLRRITRRGSPRRQARGY